MARILLEPPSRALVVENPHPALDEHLAAFGLVATRLDSVPSEDALIDALRRTGAQVMFKRSRVPVTRRVVEACPDLLAVQLCCIGDDSIDKRATADHGVLVFNDPFSNARSVVELAMGHLVALSRRLYETDVEIHDHVWKKTNQGRYEIHGKTLGIVGMGNIGRQVAKAATDFGVDVQFYDNRAVAQEVGVEMGYRRVGSLSALFRTSDFVSVHVSARDARGRDNEGFLDPYLGELGADRPGSSPRLFLNLARGNLYAAEALLDAVNTGAIRRAAVDVFPEEPKPGQGSWHNPYAHEWRIACTPHIGASTLEAQPRIARRVASTQERWVRRGGLRDCVYSPRTKLSVDDQGDGRAVLAVVHSTARGAKKALDDAIYEAGASNLGSVHRDFPNGVAYDLALIDQPLPLEALQQLVRRADDLASQAGVVRSLRQIVLDGG